MPSSRPALLHRPTTWVHYTAAAICTILSATAFRQMHLNNPVAGFQAAMDKATGVRAPEGMLTGIEAIDTPLHVIVTAFMPAISGADKSFQLISIYFLCAFLPCIAVFYVEAGRKVNQWSLVAFPAAYVLFYQTIGGAVIVPLYYMAHMRVVSKRSGYYTVDSLAIPANYAKAILPSVLLGYGLPTLLMYLPLWDAATQWRLTVLWQFSPLFVGVLIVPLSAVLSGSKAKGASLKYLDISYDILFVMSVILHWGFVAYCVMSKDPASSLTAVLDLRDVSRGTPMVAGIKYIFQVDFWVVFATTLVWLFVSVYDLRLEGKTTLGSIQALVGLVGGYVLLGPAAVISLTWCWREHSLAKVKSS